MTKDNKWRMNNPQLAGVTLGLFVIIIIGIIVAWSGKSGSAEPVVLTVDTVYTDTTVSTTKSKKSRKPKTKKPRKQPQQPTSRPYLDQPVD